MECQGNAEDHCCYLDGKPCMYLEENTVPGRRWACRLRRELGSWESVYADARYQENVKPMWRRTKWPEANCGEWPFVGMTCATCGIRNDG